MFRSFYLAGFECATGWNRHREWIDQIAATGHDGHVDADYVRLASAGIHAVREGIRWPLVDVGGRFDFSSAAPFAQAAVRHGFDVIWDLFHYGYPQDADPFAPGFADRFARYCRAAARFVGRWGEGPHYFTPVNEPSYFAWAGAEVGHFAPHVQGRGFELKLALARAAIAGVEAIREELPAARMVNVDPICRVVPAGADAASLDHARLFNEQWVFEFWDMVAGRKLPELGGSPRHLDIVGINYYWTNQWQLGREGVPLADDDPRRVPLADLVRAVWRRYGNELVISETSALGDARAPWIGELAVMAAQLLAEEVPLRGICLYPILGMPQWHARDEWTAMGLWDLEWDGDALQRRPCSAGLLALQAAQRATRAHDLVREQAFTLERTGDSPFHFVGHLVWQRADPHGRSLRLFRSNRPYRLWVAALVLPTATGMIEHVCTAARLPMLLEQLQGGGPGRGHRDGIADGGVAHAGWHVALDELAAHAGMLEATPVPPQRSDQVAAYPVPGGGRH